jgi:hypothetical protein
MFVSMQKWCTMNSVVLTICLGDSGIRQEIVLLGCIQKMGRANPFATKLN